MKTLQAACCPDNHLACSPVLLLYYPCLPLPFPAAGSELAAVLRGISSGEGGRVSLLDGLLARFAAACSGAPVLSTLHRLAEAFALACLAYMLDGGYNFAWQTSRVRCRRPGKELQ